MIHSPISVEEVSFKVNGLTISAKRWNKGASHKAIALHGWLDNCSSFDLTAPHLNGVEFLAIDSAGHGNSDFRSPDSQYLIWSEVTEVFDIADQLGWDAFNLVSHSRGAGIAALCSGTFPERILKLVLIEGGIPLPMEASDVPENLATHILDNRQLAGSKGTVFKSRQAAIAARANGFTKISLEAAEVLASRSLLETEGGFQWHADARLKARSSLKLTHKQVDAFLNRISCPVLFIEGQNGILKTMPFAEVHLSNISQLQRAELPGGHHLHMEESATKCGKLISEFL